MTEQLSATPEIPDKEPLAPNEGPWVPDGTETRREVIGGALWDARQFYPGMNVVELGDYVERKIKTWEEASRTSERVPREEL